MEILECVNLVKRRRDIYLIFKGRSRTEVNVRKIKVNNIARQGEGGEKGGALRRTRRFDLWRRNPNNEKNHRKVN